MTLILDTLKTLDESRRDDVERWFQARRQETPPHLYNSVDLRHSGIRLAPVDTNLYPAGFHNLSPAARARASRYFRQYFSDHYPQAKHVLIIPESHTRNFAYRDNLVTLMALLSGAGMDVRIGSLAAAPGEPIVLESPSGVSFAQYPLRRKGAAIELEDGFSPDVVVLNNDMTSGVPELLQGLTQPILPPPSLGWWRRRKSVHFGAYKALAEDFAGTFALDPWLISAEYHSCGRVDFKEQTGLDCVAKGIERVLSRARAKHEQYGIKEAPYVFIKADSGTYGMGIMTAESPDEVLSINKKTRNKMQVIKEGAQVSEVIIQEGVPTADKVDDKPAEPMVYLIDGLPVGGMYRVNGARDAKNNLNAAGMEFTGMCDQVEDECGQWKSVQDCHFRSFGIIAAMAAMAAAREQYDKEKTPPTAAQSMAQACC